MFTETELRDALEHSAARADDPDLLTPTTPTTSKTPKPSRRWLLPLVAAAAVVALAVGLVVSGTARRQPRPADVASAGVVVDLVDRAVAGVDAEYTFKDAAVRATGGQHISRALGATATDGTVYLAVLPAAFVDSNQVQRGRRVPIAGTTGWLAERTLYELDGQEGAAPGQDDPLPEWTIAFATPGGDWAFASIATLRPSPAGDGTYVDTTVRDSAKITAAYDALKIRWMRDAARQPLRFTSLPSGMRLTSASVSRTNSKVTREELTLDRHGTDSIEVTLAVRSKNEVGPNCLAAPGSIPRKCQVAERSVAGATLTVVGRGNNAAAARRVLDGITVAPNVADYVGFAGAFS